MRNCIRNNTLNTVIFYLYLYLIINKIPTKTYSYQYIVHTDTICGGFVGPKKVYRACRFKKFYFCNPFRYWRYGKYCKPS